MYNKYKNYIKSILISFGIMCIIYGYMLANFWWGNHDWGYLLSGASFKSGLFEARYSQHLFTIFMLDSHILPVLNMLMGIICICLQGAVIGKYLGVREKYWFLLSVFIGINPHIYAVFYYVYLIFPFTVWSLFGVLLLFLSEGKYKFIKFLMGCIGYFLVLGSYPPNLALVFVLFVGKRVLCYIEGKENLKNICIRVMNFIGQIIVSVLIYRVVYDYLLENRLLNTSMYNIKTKSLMDVFYVLPLELWKSVTQLFYSFSFLGYGYFIPLFLLVVTAFYVLLYKAKNRYVVFIGIILILLASRFAFIVSTSSDMAVFRLMYWGRLGIYIYSLSVLFNENKKWVKNILFIVLIIFFSNNIIINFEIQKVQNLGFIAGRLYQKRLLDTIVLNENYNKDAEYISVNFGQIDFKERFYSDKLNTDEILGYKLSFDFDVAKNLFWEENQSQVIVSTRIDGNVLLFINRDMGNKKWREGTYWKNNTDSINNIKYWLYKDAKPYPSDNFAYIDDKYMILIIDPLIFYKYRELVIRGLDL